MIPDRELENQIKTSLVEDTRVSSQHIEVDVRDGVITLRGTVQSHRRKLAAVEHVSLLEGRRQIVDRIVVAPVAIISDARISEDARATLEAHPDVTKEAITVSTRDGVVTLRGTVASQWERALAEDVIQDLRGVRAVRNWLTIDAGEQLEDAALSRNIQTALNLQAALREATLRVAVSGGSVVLSGYVAMCQHRELAESIAARFGFRVIHNEIVSLTE